ncbi:major facilitator superfamily transporter [Fusarium bulbicola]|nr:major facilitator superfamily transporter [Fusarium bulbicola]
MAPLEASPLISSTIQQSATPEVHRAPSRRRTILFLLLYLVFLDLGYELIMPAQTQVLERIYCRIYYEDHDYGLHGGDANGGIDERLCKVGGIQSEVAMLKGWQVTLDSIGMLVFSVPLAHIADVRGRKPVLLLLTSALFAKYAFVQLVCFFDGVIPLRWSWLSALHTVLGGSVTVATALTYTIIFDVVPENDSFLPGYGRDDRHTVPWSAHKRSTNGLEPLATNGPGPGC